MALLDPMESAWLMNFRGKLRAFDVFFFFHQFIFARDRWRCSTLFTGPELISADDKSPPPPFGRLLFEKFHVCPVRAIRSTISFWPRETGKLAAKFEWKAIKNQPPAPEMMKYANSVCDEAQSNHGNCNDQ